MQVYLKYLDRLIDSFALIAPLAIILGFLETVLDILKTEVDLIVLIILLVFIDLVSGVVSAYNKGRPITSRRLKDTVIKSIEYVFLLSAAIAFTNVFGYREGTLSFIVNPAISGLSTAVFFYIALVEITSIFENVTSDKGKAVGTKILDKLNSMFSSDEKE